MKLNAICTQIHCTINPIMHLTRTSFFFTITNFIFLVFTATSHCQGLWFNDPLWILNMCGCSTGIMLFLLWACGHCCKNRRVTKLAFCAWVFSLLFTAILTALGVLIYINQKYNFLDDVTPAPSPSCNYLRLLPMATAGSMTTLCALFCLVSLCCCVVL